MQTALEILSEIKKFRDSNRSDCWELLRQIEDICEDALPIDNTFPIDLDQASREESQEHNPEREEWEIYLRDKNQEDEEDIPF